MLTVQINYNTLQESIRHNLATERQAANELAEAHRHNITYENETMRHNLATESIQQATLQETVRHNVEIEGISWYEAMTHRNLAESEIALNTARIGLTNAQTDLAHAQASHQNLVNAMDQMYMTTERDTELAYKQSVIELNAENTQLSRRKQTTELVNNLGTEAGLIQNQASIIVSSIGGLAKSTSSMWRKK